MKCLLINSRFVILCLSNNTNSISFEPVCWFLQDENSYLYPIDLYNQRKIAHINEYDSHLLVSFGNRLDLFCECKKGTVVDKQAAELTLLPNYESLYKDMICNITNKVLMILFNSSNF